MPCASSVVARLARQQAGDQQRARARPSGTRVRCVATVRRAAWSPATTMPSVSPATPRTPSASTARTRDTPTPARARSGAITARPPHGRRTLLRRPPRDHRQHRGGERAVAADAGEVERRDADAPAEERDLRREHQQDRAAEYPVQRHAVDRGPPAHRLAPMHDAVGSSSIALPHRVRNSQPVIASIEASGFVRAARFCHALTVASVRCRRVRRRLAVPSASRRAARPRHALAVRRLSVPSVLALVARARGLGAPPSRSADGDRHRSTLALIEGLSGPFANAGEAVYRNLVWAVERVNARGGVKLRDGPHPLRVDRYDSKGQTDEALSALRAAIDDGIHFVLQGNSSATAAALVDAIDRNNERDPERSVVFLNYAAVDPALTNERCSFWHFRFDAHADMRMTALIEAIRDDPSVKRVYLIGQDYSFGQAVLREARRQLADARPDLADRRRGAAPARPGQGLRAVRGEDRRERRGRGRHRQLGQRPDAAGQGGARRGVPRALLHVLRQRARRAGGDPRGRHRPGGRRRGLDAERADPGVGRFLSVVPRALPEACRRLRAPADAVDDRGARAGDRARRHDDPLAVARELETADVTLAGQRGRCGRATTSSSSRSSSA